MRRRVCRPCVVLAILCESGSLVSSVTGCSNVEPVASYAGPETDLTQLYTRLTLDYPAVTLSTATGYNTLQLTATPRDRRGDPMPNLSAPIYTSSDTQNVEVTAAGLVTARGVATGVLVVATLTAAGPVTHADTAVINVTNVLAPPKLASLSIQPVPPDSATRPIATYPTPFFSTYTLSNGGINPFLPQLQPLILDSDGNVVGGLPVEFVALDPTVLANRRSGFVLSSGSIGRGRVVARTTAYGITVTDTVTYNFTWPLGDDILVYSRPNSGSPGFSVNTLASTGIPVFADDIHIAPMGVVVWVNMTHNAVDVVFDDPASAVEPPVSICEALFNVYSGNCSGDGNVQIPANPDADPSSQMSLGMTLQIRQFPSPGVYTYHSAATGTSGRVVVSTGLDD